jgi:hypothetical protein
MMTNLWTDTVAPLCDQVMPERPDHQPTANGSTHHLNPQQGFQVVIIANAFPDLMWLFAVALPEH